MKQKLIIISNNFLCVTSQILFPLLLFSVVFLFKMTHMMNFASCFKKYYINTTNHSVSSYFNFMLTSIYCISNIKPTRNKRLEIFVFLFYFPSSTWKRLHWNGTSYDNVKVSIGLNVLLIRKQLNILCHSRKINHYNYYCL